MNTGKYLYSRLFIESYISNWNSLINNNRSLFIVESVRYNLYGKSIEALQTVDYTIPINIPESYHFMGLQSYDINGLFPFGINLIGGNNYDIVFSKMM